MPDTQGRQYGNHLYPSDDRTSNCSNGCGCWMGNSNSGGPLGLDPFGKCPNNPIGAGRLPGNQDHENVVNERIKGLEERALTAEIQLRAVEPSKKQLARSLFLARVRIHKLELVLRNFAKELKGLKLFRKS